MINFLSWIDANLKDKNDAYNYNLPWNILFASTLWNIWLRRNDLQFNEKDQNWNQIVMKSIEFTKTTCLAFNNNLGDTTRADDRLIKWCFQRARRIKINTDGSCLGCQGYLVSEDWPKTTEEGGSRAFVVELEWPLS